MKPTLLVAALAAAPWIGPAQEPVDDPVPQDPGKLQKVEPPRYEFDDVPADPQPAFDAEAWRARLVDPDLEARERAYGALLERAGDDAGARRALRDWAQGADELAWTARLALRELRRTPSSRLPRTFQSDPFGPGDPFSFGGRDPFEAMRERMERMLEDFHRQDPFDAFGGDPFDALPPGIHGRSRSFSLRSTPEGVEVDVEEVDEDGQRTQKTYRAESLEALYEAHPELRERTGLRVFEGPGELRGWDDLRRGLERFGVPRTGRGLAPQGAPPRPERLEKADHEVTRTDVLGVVLREPAAQDEVGLVVERVLPGTIAAALRLREGDRLLELNGTPLRSTEDVRRTLAGRDARGAVSVRVRGLDGSLETLTWTPER